MSSIHSIERIPSYLKDLDEKYFKPSKDMDPLLRLRDANNNIIIPKDYFDDYSIKKLSAIINELNSDSTLKLTKYQIRKEIIPLLNYKNIKLDPSSRLGILVSEYRESINARKRNRYIYTSRARHVKNPRIPRSNLTEHTQSLPIIDHDSFSLPFTDQDHSLLITDQDLSPLPFTEEEMNYLRDVLK